MRKAVFLTSVILIAAVVLLTSCAGIPLGGLVDDDPPLTRVELTESAVVTAGTQIEDVPDIYSIISGVSGNAGDGTVWGLQDPAVRQRIIDSAKANGFEVSFGPDGTMTVKDGDGSVFEQGSDGTWSQQNDNGQGAQIGGEWPDNEFTRLLPRPDFPLSGSALTESDFTAAFNSVDVDSIRAYADRVKAKGFTVDAEETDQNVYGVTLYTYSAYNDEGYQVEITFASGTCGVTVSK